MEELIVISNNVTSLKANITRRREMEQLACDAGAGVVLLQETRLGPKMSLRFTNMNTYRNDDGAGTAVLINNRIKAVQVYIDGLQVCDMTAIKIFISGRTTLIMSLYIPPTAKYADITADLQLIRREVEMYDDFLIGGDFNAHNPSWSIGITKKNATGRALEDMMRHEAADWCVIASTQPTFRNVSNIDMFIMKTDTARPLRGVMRISTAWCHSAIAVKTSWNTGNAAKNVPPTKTSFEGTNWPFFRERMTAELSKIPVPKLRNLSNTEVDIIIEETSEAIRRCVAEVTVRTQVRQSDRRKLPDDLLKLAAKKRRIVELKKRDSKCNPYWTQTLKQLYADADISFRNKVQIFEEKVLNEDLAAIRPGVHMFAQVKRFCNRGYWKIGKLRDENGNSITEEEKLDAFATYYTDLYEENTPVNPNLEEIIANWKEVKESSRTIQFSEDNTALEPREKVLVSSSQITNLTKRANNKKSAGSDGIPNCVLRKMPKIFADISTILYNNCLANGYFPRAWKEAIILPIPKTATAKQVKEHRPISLLANWGKIFEDVLIGMMRSEDGEMPGVPDFQFAYRRGHSTVHPIELIKLEQADAERRGKMIGMVSLDVSKAFDSVWKEGLIHKLKVKETDPTVLKTIASFMEDRKAAVKVENSQSEQFALKRGVPQGSKLGPLLYNLYTADMTGGNNDLEGVIQYADDTLLWKKAKGGKEVKEHLEEKAQRLKTEMAKWGIQLNETKTKVIYAGKNKNSKKFLSKNRTKIGNAECEATREVKHLGAWITDEKVENSNLKEALRRGWTAFAMVKWIVMKKGMSTRVKKNLYTQLILPSFLYGCQAWNFTDGQLAKLKLAERKILRMMTGMYRRSNKKYYSNIDLYKELDIKKNIEERIVERRVKYEKAIDQMENQWFINRRNVLKERERAHKEKMEYIKQWKAEKAIEREMQQQS